MKRVIWLVMDSFGVGSAPDAAKFGDTGANTLGHIAQYCAEGHCDSTERSPEQRQGPLRLPVLQRLGLGKLAELSMGYNPFPDGQRVADSEILGIYGCASERSYGKDTPSGHWEMAGVPVEFDWGYFAPRNSFPAELTQRILNNFEPGMAELGYLGNCHASGTEILKVCGEEHMQTGKPIFYTSADSVFQIACHEESFGLERLYRLCEVARQELDEYGRQHGQIGRVIARPFVGQDADSFQRTGNRHDYSVLPPAPTVLNRLQDDGGEVVSIGKIADIFAHSGISHQYKATGLKELGQKTLEAMNKYQESPSIIFTNFVDFDSSYGHRRDVQGYAWALEFLDAWLGQLLPALASDDLLLIAADHGCDPTWQGTDHTREYIPVLTYHKQMQSKCIGVRETFADIGQSVASYLGLSPCEFGRAFL